MQRYDGKNFKTFYNIPGNKNSFPQGEITDIKEDKFGRYWITIGEHGGLCIYNPANESITRFNSSTDTLFTESNGLSEVEFAADSSTALLSSFYGLYKFDVSINGNDSLFDTYDLEYNSKGEIIFLSYNYIPDFSSGYNESYNYNSLGNVAKVLHFPIGIVSKRLYNTKYSSYEEYTVSKYDDKLNFMCGIYRYRFMELFKRKKLLVHLVY